MPQFVIPRSLRDLESPPDGGESEDRLYVHKAFEVDSLDAAEIDDLIKGVAFDLADKEVLCIEEQDIFDQIYSLVSGFSSLNALAKANLIESLCSNFSVLLPNITSLLTSVKEASADFPSLRDHIHSHRNAFRIYAYFLQCILQQGQGACDSAPEDPAPRANGKSKQSRKKHVPQSWNWEGPRARILRLLAAALNTDLGQLFGNSNPEEGLLSLLMRGAFAMLENPSLLKDKDVKEALSSTIGACSTKYHYLEQCTGSLINLLLKHEHLSLYFAEVAASSEEKYHDGSLAMAMLREIGRMSPKEYARDGPGAENVGKFLVELADRLPKLMVTNLGILMPQFGGESYKIRNALVASLGKLVRKAFVADGDSGSMSNINRLRSKQAMLDVLFDRSRDVSAYTRSKVLQVWAELCEERALSIGLWNQVTAMAAGRLEDKTALVRKSALSLLTTLLQYNPFGPQLKSAAFEATLEKYKEQLSEMAANEAEAEAEAEVEVNINECEGLVTRDPEAGKDIGSDSLAESQVAAGESRKEREKLISDVGGLEQTRALVASLEAGLQFTKCIASGMPVLVQLLSSSTASDVENTIQLLMCARQFSIDGAEACMLKMLPLVFSQDKGIYDAVESAFMSIYVKKNSMETASNLINLALVASIGDLASLEILIGNLMKKGEISQSTVSALWDHFTFNVPGITAEQSRGALVILCMAAKSSPKIFQGRTQNIVDIGFGRRAKEDLLLARTACCALQHLSDEDRLSLVSNNQKIFNNLANLVLTSCVPEEIWYGAAEQAINAIYTLHPMPERFAASILRRSYRLVYVTSGSSQSLEEPRDDGLDDSSPSRDSVNDSVPVNFLSRFLFLVGHIALKQLVYIDSCVRKVRKWRSDMERRAAASALAADTQDSELDSSQSVNQPQKEDDINKELGVAASEDARLDGMQEKAEKQILSRKKSACFLIGSFAPLVTKICKNFALLKQYPVLQSSAMLALCKLMVLDTDYCEANLQLLFTVAQNAVEENVRSNCMIAIGDLAVRFPNLLEPWTEHVYARLHDASPSVRKNAVLVVSHLILNDMMKVKGHISEMALRLEDEDQRISNLVKLFFHELSKKGSNPIYNLLPDMLSHLSSMRSLSEETFGNIMQFLIGSIKKDKQMEGLIEKLCNRLSGTTESKQWRDITYCLSQLTYTEKGVKKLADLFRSYQHTLADEEVANHFRATISKAKKFAKPDVRIVIDELEEKLTKCHEEMKDLEATARNAEAHQRSQLEAKSLLDNIGSEAGGVGAAEELERDGDEASGASEGSEALCSGITGEAMSGDSASTHLVRSPEEEETESGREDESGEAATSTIESDEEPNEESTARISVCKEEEESDSEETNRMRAAARKRNETKKGLVCEEEDHNLDDSEKENVNSSQISSTQVTRNSRKAKTVQKTEVPRQATRSRRR